MQVRRIIVGRVDVDMVDNLPTLRTGYFPVLPFPARSRRAVSQSLSARRVRTVCSFCRRPCGRSIWHRCDRPLHQVSPASMYTRWQGLLLAPIRVERVTVTVPHLIMALAHLPSDDGPAAVLTGAPYDATSPTVVGGAVTSDALVVHQAISVRRVLPTAAVNRAHLSQSRRRHESLRISQAAIITYKALGNSMAVPVLSWLLDRIRQVDAIREGRAAA